MKRLIDRVHQAAVLNGYDDFSVGEYFRQQGAEIGEDNRLMIRSLGQDPYLIKIGNHCSISWGVCFINHDGSGWIFNHENPSVQRFGSIEIKDNCFIGVNAVILPNVTIGPNSIVGACSVVTKDVPPNTVVCGNPARVVKTIEAYKKKIYHIWEEQQPENYFKDVQAGTIYSPNQIQKMKNRDHALLKNHLEKILMKRDKK